MLLSQILVPDGFFILEEDNFNLLIQYARVMIFG